MDFVILLKNIFWHFYFPVGKAIFGSEFRRDKYVPMRRKIVVALVCLTILAVLVSVLLWGACGYVECKFGGSLS